MNFVRLFLLLFLCFSFVFAVPSSTSPGSFLPIKRVLAVQEDLFDRKGEVGEMVEVEGRMDIEGSDYPGTGANNHHDPNAPGKP